MNFGKSLKLTPDQIAKAILLRADRVPWEKIGDCFGVTAKCVQWAIDPKLREKKQKYDRERRARKRREAVRASIRPNAGHDDFRPTLAEFLARAREIPPDTRDLTGVLMGDPLIGRRALDRMQGGRL